MACGMRGRSWERGKRLVVRTGLKSSLKFEIHLRPQSKVPFEAPFGATADRSGLVFYTFETASSGRLTAVNTPV